MKKQEDYIANIKDAERRFYNDVPELRAVENSDKKAIRGLGIVYNSLSENFAPWMQGGMYEIIEPGAARGLLNNEDIMILFNHDPNLVLARNMNTAQLVETDAGVEYIYDTPNTTVGNDLQENIRLKNVRKSSFAFKAKEVRNEVTPWAGLGKINLRRIVKFEEFYDFSPVTYPAYADTTVAQRSLKEFVEAEENQAKAYLVDVMRRKHEIYKMSLTR